MSAIIAIAAKDLRLLLRDKAGFFFTCVFPLLIAVFFGAMFSGGGQSSGKMPVLVVDEDRTDGSRAYVGKLKASAELEVTAMERAKAFEEVRRGRATAVIVLKPGVGAGQENMFWGKPPGIALGVDPARRAEAGMLQGILTKYAVEGMQEGFAKPEKMRDSVARARQSARAAADMPPGYQGDLDRFLGELDQFLDKSSRHEAETPAGGSGFQGFKPVEIETVEVVRHRIGPTNAFAVSFPQGIIWGIIGCAAAFGLSLVVERTHGTLVRLQLAPLGRLQILGGKALACFTAIVAQAVVLFGIGLAVFGIRTAAPGLLLLAIFSSAVAFVGIMMLLSVLGRTERSAGGIGWAIMLVMSMIGGGMIPLFIMPAWMVRLSHLSPVKWAVLAFEGATWRQFTTTEMLLPCGILLGVGGGLFLLGARLFRWSDA